MVVSVQTLYKDQVIQWQATQKVYLQGLYSRIEEQTLLLTQGILFNIGQV